MNDEITIPAVSDEYSSEEASFDDAQIEYLDQGGYQSSYDDYSTGYQTQATTVSITPDTGTLSNFTLGDLVQMAVVYAFIIAAALSAVYIFVGGMSFILSGGNDEKIKQAINTIRYAIIGLVITILSFTFVTIVGRMFGLNFMDYLSYGKVKDSINRIISPMGGADRGQNFEIQQ